MFDALLGRTFTAKCKHGIKCINERLKPIRNRKQSVVNIQRNDIADLLRSGNAEHAFGRMDELIIEMNRLACYDMIEKYCENVLIQLPLLQKQRDGLPEDREAMSTLIFAAARFSDLPELCDLRQIFTARYGSSLEMSVSPEFKDQSTTKAFSAAKKLQLMKSIASDFSVSWDSKSFEYRITNPTASKCDQPKKRDAAPKALPVSEKDGLFRQVATKAKDIHVMNHEPDSTRRIKPWADEPEKMTPPPTGSSNPHTRAGQDEYANHTEEWRRKNDTHRVSARTREVLDPINRESKAVEQLKSKDEYGGRIEVPSGSWEPNGTDAGYRGSGADVYKMSSRAQMMSKLKREEGGDVVEQTKSKNETSVRHAVRPPVQQESDGIDAKESHDIVYKRSSRARMDYKDEEKQAVGQQAFVESVEPRKVPQFVKHKDMNDVISSDGRDRDDVHEKPMKARQETTDIAGQEGRVVEPQRLNNNRGFHMIPPPYVKSAISKAGANSEQAKPSSQPTDEGVFGASDSRPTHEAKDKSNINGAYKDLPKDELVADDERSRPRSVRRKHQKPPFVQEADGIIYDDEPVPRSAPHGQRRRSSRQNTNIAPHDNYDEEEKVMDKLLTHYSKKGMPDQPSKHGTRTRALPPDHSTPGEGETVQYETYGSWYQIHKLETVKAARRDHTINHGEVNRQQSYQRHRSPKAEPMQVLPPDDHVVRERESTPHGAYGRYQAHGSESARGPERAVSLPPDPVTPKEIVIKGSARTTSMLQPGHLPSPHPRPQPDYQELAARFAHRRVGSK